ncbi:hypothetical protein SLE2022_304790 [Rubroshorea leprosula]
MFNISVDSCVHSEALLDGEGLELGETEDHDNGTEENRGHSKDDFCVFYLGYTAKFPWIRSSGLLSRWYLNGCFVQEPVNVPVRRNSVSPATPGSTS